MGGGNGGEKRQEPFFRVSQVSLTSEPGDVPETDLLHLC